MCVSKENTRQEDVELVETLANTMTESTELGNFLLVAAAMIRAGATLCMAMAPEPAEEQPPTQRPPGIYPPN